MNLSFNSAGRFVIVQFTDLHYRNGEEADRQTLGLMDRVLDAGRPDLVVLTGDVIDGSFCRDPLRSYADAVGPVTRRGIPWAAVFGNHDDEGSASRRDLLAMMQTLPGCLAAPGPASLSGVGNHVLTITGKAGPAARLWFLDSHAYADASQKTYDWIRPDQIDWYLRSPHDLPGLMFFHIPIPEFDDVWHAGHCAGSKFESVCCPTFDSGLFEAIKAAGDIDGVFVGHDHVNDYSGELHGIGLTYGRCTGYASYGRAGFPRGARIIRLTEGKPGFSTETVTAGS